MKSKKSKNENPLKDFLVWKVTDSDHEVTMIVGKDFDEIRSKLVQAALRIGLTDEDYNEVKASSFIGLSLEEIEEVFDANGAGCKSCNFEVDFF